MMAAVPRGLDEPCRMGWPRSDGPRRRIADCNLFDPQLSRGARIAAFAQTTEEL